MNRKKLSSVDSALWALEAGKAAMAFAELKDLAETGEADAFHMLACLYDAGQGTKRNRKAAMRWYLRA